MGVRAYRDGNFSGASIKFDKSTPYVGKDWNDKISSVEIDPYTHVTFYGDGDYKGSKRIEKINATDAVLRMASLPNMNDAVSSIGIKDLPRPAATKAAVKTIAAPALALIKTFAPAAAKPAPTPALAPAGPAAPGTSGSSANTGQAEAYADANIFAPGTAASTQSSTATRSDPAPEPDAEEKHRWRTALLSILGILVVGGVCVGVYAYTNRDSGDDARIDDGASDGFASATEEVRASLRE